MRQFCHICKKQMDLVVDADSGEMKCVFCGTVLFTPNYAKLDFGTIINGFLIESKIGQGGMGVVYKAKQLNLERYVALKVLAEHLADDHEFVERFFKEARAAANLSHQNIVQVYDAGSTIDGIYYFAMELVEGETVESCLLREGSMLPQQALDVAVKIAHALEYAWERQKLMHGDIKPDNIIINTSGGVKLSDLGLAKTIHDDKTLRDGGIMATPLYAPPEVISGNFAKIGFQSDMYSFGATIYHMFVGTPPFNAEDPEVVFRMHLMDSQVPIKERIKDINPALSDIVDRLLAKKPEERPSTWSEVVSSLEKIKDVERKVFHISMSSHGKGGVETATASIKTGNKHSQLILLLFLIFLLLASITLSIYFKSLKEPRNTSQIAPITSSSDAMAKEWELIKTRVNAMSPHDAIIMIDKFMQKYHDCLPEDAEAVYALVRKKAADELLTKEKIKKTRDALTNEVDKIIKSFSTGEYKGQDFSDLMFLLRKIEMSLALSSSGKINLDIGSEKREKLNSIYFELSQYIDSIRRIEEDAYKRKVEEERLKLIEMQRIQKEKADKERAEKLAINIALDSYYSCLAEKSGPIQVNSTLGEIIKDNGGTLPKEVHQTIDFIKSNYVSAPDALVKQLIKIEQSLKNISLPIAGIPRDYKIEEISEKGIKFQTVISKVKMGKVVQWQQLSADELKMIIDKHLLANNAYVLDPSELSLFASYLVENKFYEQLRVLLNKSSNIDTAKRNGWLSFISELEIASREIDVIKKMGSLREFLSAKNQIQASERLAEMILYHYESATYHRYSSEIELIFRELRCISHIAQVSRFLSNVYLLQREKKYPSALQNLYCAKSRIFNAESRQEMKDLVAKMEKSLMSEIPPAANLPRNFAPFYNWERETAGETIAFISNNTSNPDLQSAMATKPEILSFINMSGKLSLGDWDKNLPNIGKIGSIDRLQGSATVVIPSLFFALSLHSDRFSSTSEELFSPSQKFYPAIERFRNSPSGYALTISLFAEYLLSIGDFQEATQVLSTFQYHAFNERESKIFLLSTYAWLNRDQQIAPSFSQDTLSAIAPYKKVQTLSGDIVWLKHSMTVLSGKQLSDENIEELSSTSPLHADICFRIMLSCLSQRIISSRMSGNDLAKILRMILSKMHGMTAHSQTFRNLSYLRLYLNVHLYSALNLELSRILSEPLVAGIASYPEFSMLHLVSAKASGILAQENVQKVLRARLMEATCVSPFEMNAATAIDSPDKYLEILEATTAKGHIGKAYAAAIAYLIFSSENSELCQNILSELKNHSQSLNTEQRLLLSEIGRLISKDWAPQDN